jgi:hypothetical protein
MALPVTGAEMRAKQVPQGAVDPNIRIPQQIIDAGKRSEAIQQAIAGAAEPSVAAAVAEGQNQPAEGQTAGTPQEPGQPPESRQEPVAPIQAPQDEQSWEHRFKSLQGRYDADVRKSRDAVTRLSDRLDQLERENNLLRNAQPASQADQANGEARSLTEAEIADYGPEFVDVMRRVAAETAGPLQAEIRNLRGQLGYVQQETGNAFLTRMNSTIESMIPNWADLNRDPRFIQWSQLPDVFSGAIRKTLMQDAWNSGDAQRVAAFFQAFLTEEAATNPQGGTGQRLLPPSRMVVSDTPVGPSSPGAPLDLASLAAPGRAHSAGDKPAEKPVYTSAEITRFYTDVAAGRWRGRDAQRIAIDHDIMAAQREGRIIPDQRTQLPRDPYTR